MDADSIGSLISELNGDAALLEPLCAELRLAGAGVRGLVRARLAARRHSESALSQGYRLPHENKQRQYNTMEGPRFGGMLLHAPREPRTADIGKE